MYICELCFGREELWLDGRVEFELRVARSRRLGGLCDLRGDDVGSKNASLGAGEDSVRVPSFNCTLSFSLKLRICDCRFGDSF